MADNSEEPSELAPSDPVRPPEGAPPVDGEQWQRFQEFQRFQEYVRYSQTGGTKAPGAPPPGQPPIEVHRQLSEIHNQLTEVTASQQRTEREINPPLWKKLLRSRWLFRLLMLIVIVVLATWAYRHFFGSSSNDGGTPTPPPRQTAAGAPQLGGQTPTATVIGIYGNLGADLAGDVCAVFTPTGARQFAADFGARDCHSAVHKLAREVTNKTAYANSTVSSASLGGNGDSYRMNHFTVSSCAAHITGGPTLGAFNLTRAPNRTWLVSGHHKETC
ncbi:MAG: hypothetical protein ACRDRN_04410 [Sciscionella sp.]